MSIEYSSMYDQRFILTSEEIDLLASELLEDEDEPIQHASSIYLIEIVMGGLDTTGLFGIIDVDDLYLEIKPRNLIHPEFEVSDYYGCSAILTASESKYTDVLNRLKDMFLIYFENMSKAMNQLTNPTEE